MTAPPAFLEALVSPGRAADLADADDIFGFLPGSWELHAVLHNPAAPETSADSVARRSGEGIRMEGKLPDGTPIRWRYQSITPTSFHYSAESLQSDSHSWTLYLELFGKRSD